MVASATEGDQDSNLADVSGALDHQDAALSAGNGVSEEAIIKASTKSTAAGGKQVSNLACYHWCRVLDFKPSIQLSVPPRPLSVYSNHNV